MKKLLLLVTLISSAFSAFSQCNITYVTSDGLPSNAGTMAAPLDITTAITTASQGDLIRMAVGNYVLDAALSLPFDDIIIEGGYDDFNAWERTSLAGATTIHRSALNPEGSPNEERLVALYIDGKTGFELHDITITTANATNAGMSTYGLHLQGCSNYRIVRCQVLPGNGANGANGINGGPGANGTPGGNGAAGSIDDECAGGQGGTGGAGGGAGGGTAVAGGTNPAGCTLPGGNGPAGTSSSNARAGGSGGGGGAGGEESENGGSGGSGGAVNGGAVQTGGGQGGVWGDPGGDGVTGWNGAAGTPGLNGSTGASGQLATFFTPGIQAPSGVDGTGGKGGVGGGGGGGQYCAFCVDGSGNGGGGGGGGGQGGQAGTGGYGGGGSFGIYIYANGLNGNIIDSYVAAGSAGTGGNGGLGGSGGLGGGGGTGPNNGSSEIGEGGEGGSGGAGGIGGNGGNGASGLAYAVHLVSGDALSTNAAGFDLAAQPEITTSYATCTGEVIEFRDMSLPVGASNALWNFGATASSQFATSNPASTGFNATGMVSVTQSGNTYTDFVHITCQVDASATQNGNTLTANAAGATYQWVDCNVGYFPVAGATAASFTPTVTGSYAVVVTENDCTDTSACFLVDYSAINEKDQHAVSIYPNPIDEVLYLVASEGTVEGKLKIFSSAGALLETHSIKSVATYEVVFNYPKGVYLIEFESAQERSVKRFVKL